jgi:hypothetical protein
MVGLNILLAVDRQLVVQRQEEKMSVWHLVGIMIVTGIVGGTINLALTRPERIDPLAWLWSVLAGIGAAFLMPLFMRIISSTLLTSIVGTGYSTEDVLVFAAFCLLAAISSKAFIQSLTDKVLQQVNKAVRDAGEAKEQARITKEKTETSTRELKAVSTSTLLGIAAKPASDEEKWHIHREILPGPDKNDPWAGQFGGSSTANNRRLEADIRPIPDLTDWCSITLRVFSTDQRRFPLTEEVQLYLHDSFLNNKPIIPVNAKGIAELTIAAWGAFTVGAIADRGETLLEIDLSKLPEAPEPFRSR